jgi:hypothetical protein
VDERHDIGRDRPADHAVGRATTRPRRRRSYRRL